MAVIDAVFIFGDLWGEQNAAFNAAAPAAGLPRLQVADVGDVSTDYGDYFVAGLVGAILAAERRPQALAALATLVAAQAFNQLFLVVDSLPGTVPPAVVLLAFEGGRPAPTGAVTHRLSPSPSMASTTPQATSAAASRRPAHRRTRPGPSGPTGRPARSGARRRPPSRRRVTRTPRSAPAPSASTSSAGRATTGIATGTSAARQPLERGLGRRRSPEQVGGAGQQRPRARRRGGTTAR